MVFRGCSPLSLDNKGRMSMPTRHRPRLREGCDGQLIVTISIDRCLLIYPLPVWEEVEQRLMALPTRSGKVRDLQRLMVGHAEDCEMDGQGRILLSASLREAAGIDKRVVLLGQGKKFELWDEDTWKRRREELLDEGGDGELPADLESLSF